MLKIKELLIVLFVTISILSCKNDDENTDSLNQEVVNQYAKIVYSNYLDIYDATVTLQNKVNALVESPSALNLNAAKEAWLKAREFYGQSEAYRFYGGPIDGENGPEGLINAWPLDEAYIDYVSGNSNSGIINNTSQFPEINEDLLESLNEKDGEENISTGFHAVEFLLWGQDISDGAGGGSRPYTDYLTEGGTAANQARRGQYLKAVTQLLVKNFETLVDEWKSNTPGNYRRMFESTPSQSIQHIFTGIGKLSKGELAGERMFVAWDEKDKEHEHSCFSDNTHRDIVNNAKGIQNVFIGKYTNAQGELIEGKGLYDLIKQRDSALATEIAQKITQSVSLAEAIQAPFDQEILLSPGRERVKATIDALRSQADKLVEAGMALGFTVNPEVN